MKKFHSDDPSYQEEPFNNKPAWIITFVGLVILGLFFLANNLPRMKVKDLQSNVSLK